MVRKVNILHREFRGDRKPVFMRNRSTSPETSVVVEEEEEVVEIEVVTAPKKKLKRVKLARIAT